MATSSSARHQETVWTCKACTFDRNDESQDSCSMCDAIRPSVSWFPRPCSRPFSICRVSSFFSTVLSGALTGTFALVGAVSGSITGALACRASQSSLIQGAGLGAVAGAVLSIEVLEASRTYWQSERSGSTSLPSMIDFFEDLLNGRFVREFLAPAISATERFQINFSEMSYEELFEVFLPAEGRLKGASQEFLKGLPYHEVTEHNKMDTCGDSICCTVCLQELEQGDIARTLPVCNHTFHLKCVDQWLERHVVCPICRQQLN